MTALSLVPPEQRADLPALAAWIDAEPGRDCRIFSARGLSSRSWFVELFNRDTCLASVGHADPAIALSRALSIAEEET